MTRVGVNESHRTQVVKGWPEFIDLARPASNFKIVERRFGGARAIHRCFSFARSQDCRCCVIESIPDVGLLAEDTGELLSLGYYCSPENFRISFYRRTLLRMGDINECPDEDFLGYAIVRHDHVNDSRVKWYVFEAVFRQYPHPHNCISDRGLYHVASGRKIFPVRGVMYCQQNAMNKACAQVALRSLLSRILSARDVPTREINEVARGIAKAQEEAFIPGKGLGADQIKAVLEKFGIKYNAVDYDLVTEKRLSEWQRAQSGWSGKSQDEKKKLLENKRREIGDEVRQSIKYERFLYDGIESGGGALLGFRLHDGRKHIIPVFGHTFNKDSWRPDSSRFYFNANKGKDSAYVPSDNWTSSFIGHDDNLGSDFCIPRASILSGEVDFAAGIFRTGVTYSGALAEAMAYKILSRLQSQLDRHNGWVVRFLESLNDGDLILRSVSMPIERYFQHLRFACDWEYNRELPEMVDELKKMDLPSVVWVVEFSLPQMFPANERKVGEVVLDATQRDWIEAAKDPKDQDGLLSILKFVRFPGMYYSPPDSPQWGRFERSPSKITSHFPLVDLCRNSDVACEVIELVFVSDARSCAELFVAACSIAEHARPDIELSFNILNRGIPSEDWPALEQKVKELHPLSRFKRLEAEEAAGTDLREFLFSSMGDTNWVIYCGCNVLWVKRDVAELWKMRDEGAAVIGGGDGLHAMPFSSEDALVGPGPYLINLRLLRVTGALCNCKFLGPEWHRLSHEVRQSDLSNGVVVQYADKRWKGSFCMLPDVDLLWHEADARYRGVSRWRSLRERLGARRVVLQRTLVLALRMPGISRLVKLVCSVLHRHELYGRLMVYARKLT